MTVLRREPLEIGAPYTINDLWAESESATASYPDTTLESEAEYVTVPIEPASMDAPVVAGAQVEETQADSSMDMSAEDMANSIYQYVDSEAIRNIIKNAAGVALGTWKPEEYHAGGKTYYVLGTISYDDLRKLNCSNDLFFRYCYVAGHDTKTCKIFAGPIEDGDGIANDELIAERTAKLKALYTFIQKAKADTVGMSDRDKADYISTWMGKNFTYDYTYKKTHTDAAKNVLNTFIEHKGICSNLSGLNCFVAAIVSA